MADIKTKGSMEKPKVKTSRLYPQRGQIYHPEKYQEQQERNAPGQKDPVRYATDHVESGGKRVARTAGDAIKQKAKNEFVKQRQHKKAQRKDHRHEQPQPDQPQQGQSIQEHPQQQSGLRPHPAEQTPFTEPASPASDKLSGFVEQNVPPVTQDPPTSETSFDMYTGDTHIQSERVSPSHYYGQNPSTKSAYFPTTNSTNSSAETQCSGKQQKTQARHSSQSRQKVIKDAKNSKEQTARQQKFNTGAQFHRIEADQQPPSNGDIHSAAHVDCENTSAKKSIAKLFSNFPRLERRNSPQCTCRRKKQP